MSIRRAIAEIDPASLNVSEFCRTHDVSRSQFYEIRGRVHREGEAGIEPRSRAPHRVANRTPAQVEDHIVALRKELDEMGADAGAATIQVFLAERLDEGFVVPSVSTVWRVLARRGFITPEPAKRPKATVRFSAERANECWQIDDFHWTLADHTPVKVIDVLDDCCRVNVASLAAPSCNAEAAFDAMTKAADQWGWPEWVLSDNGRTYKHALATALGALGIRMGHSRPYHPQTCGKVERFHGTVKKWLSAHDPATTIAELQQQLDEFRDYYNHQRPHRALTRRPPADVWADTPKSAPTGLPITTTTRVHTGKVSGGSITIHPGPRRIAVGAAYTGQHATVITTANQAHVFIAGNLIRQLTIDPNKREQPLYPRPGRPPICPE